MRISQFLAIIGSAQFGLSGPYDCHVYAIRGPGGIVLVDAGSGLAEIEVAQHLAEDFPDVPVAAVLLTHSHADHSGGADGLRHRYHCRVIASDLTAPILQAADEERSGLRRAREAGGYPPGLHMRPCSVDGVYRDGDHFMVAGLTFEAVQVRGHSHDSFCLIVEVNGHRICFSADVVFYGGILGVINAWDSSFQDYCVDLQKLQGRSIEMLFPGHGLFTLRDGQRHIEGAIQTLNNGFLPAQIGQGGGIF
jgi:glyoxylase-like metal-dependent hydrolase (beta-lactamase superfamily II)